MLHSYLPFVLFVLVMTSTPGPGNLTMMAIGQNTGFRSALPLLLGSTIGFFSLNSMVALGLGKILTSSETAALVMKIAGSLYILYLGVKILLSKPGRAKPGRFTLAEGLLIHPLSPKSWAMSVVGFSQLVDPNQALMPQAVLFVLTFMVFQVSFHSLWCGLGAVILKLLRSGSALACFNWTAVCLMFGSTAYAMLT